MPSNQENGSWYELLWGGNGLRSLALAGGVAVHAVNVYIATTILPSIVADIGGLAYYAWNTTLFVVASILGSAISPQAVGSLGLRRAFLCALAIFAAGTMVCALAPSMPVLLLGRTAQGLGGGLLLGLSYSAVRLVFDARLWSRAMVLISSMWGVATLAGPAIGGIFAQAGHWRLAFWSVLPIAAVLAVLVCTRIAGVSKHEDGPVRAPLGMISLLAVSVLAVSLGSLSDKLEWNAAGIAAGVLITGWIARADDRAAVRLFPTGSYSPFTPLGSLYASICLLSIGVTTEIYIPYFLQHIHGKSPLAAGYWTALMSAGWTLGSFASSGRRRKLADRLMLAGPAISAVSLLLLAFMLPMTSLSADGKGAYGLMPPLLGVGLGVGFCWPNMLTRIYQSAPAGQENIASAAITTLQLYAMAMGAALAGMVTNAAGFTEPGGPAGGRQAAWVLFAVFACAPGLAVFLGKGARGAGAPQGR
ncbi:MFS transporter [Parapusillimonas granuli]|uniref:MFS transporter n=1 Tax=Parapusillimonas granuli TaxID=380911 RepID=A0A853FYM5_9BURK|nr:MFS transporter [Parapusillimonas granuli]MBB5214820.1 MFS family permease [Parapusillimonas granuli]MEB2397932.1 MFS transporter [Alcaligenaceae bacterium]NYT48772.1 MFS transporter [Parapusillimonas granuli]